MRLMGRPHLWVGLLLVAPVMAGCLADDDSQPEEGPTGPEEIWERLSQITYDGVELLHVPVPGHDGKIQDTWAYIPETDDPDAEFPVFIDLSPYWGNSKPHASEGGDQFGQYLIDYYVPRGYAIVFASIRGTGDSAGCFPIGGVPELEDAYEIIDHYANIEWSNGNVAMGGRSYDGTTIQGVAAYKPHEALKLIFPVSGISDMYRYNYRGGVPYFHGIIFNTYYYEGTGVNPNDPNLLVDAVVCPELPFVQANGFGSAVTGLYTDYWDERNYNNYAENTETAFFFVHGFQDWNVKPDHILPWLDNLPDEVEKKVWLHQWEERGGHTFPMREDWNLTMLRMMDHYLKGIDTGILDEPMAQIQDSSGFWRHEDRWPPEHANETPLYLHTDTLSYESGASGTIQVDGLGGGTITWEMKLDEEVRYAGEPVLHARLATSDPEAAWVAQLYLVDENGQQEWMNEGVLKARLKDSMHMPTPIAPLQYEDYAIEFYPQDDVFPEGSTLKLTLSQSGSRFAVTADKPAVTMVDLDAEPYLELPIYEVLDPEDPQPQDYSHCWHC